MGEVFNLWDVLTSMEREHLLQKRRRQRRGGLSSSWNSVVRPFRNRYRNVIGGTGTGGDTNTDGSKDDEDAASNNDNNNELDSIVFIPSSDASSYKESISARGNGEARLKPMSATMSQKRGGNGSYFGLF